MGIHGIYKEIGPGQRIALSKYALEHFEKTGRPLRVAIDISIWLFQIQSGKGGTNPALRTFYYRLLRLISLSIHPLFVFDGPNKPPFKRNKRTGPNVASIPEFLAKQLLKQFAFPFHIAPGEAEAECALIQREGIVDAVLSEDVDTLMFGSGITFRNWTPEVNKNGTPTHVNVYDAKATKASSGLDRQGMILIALMSGGDYIPEGIPGCGPKTACEAARAGFGADLCKISRKDKVALNIWRERLAYELKTNESKHFKQKHGKLVMPEDFPRPDVLGYYTHPCISPPDKLERLRDSLKWDQDLNFPELRNFTAEAFDWTKLGGAKKFIRNLAPALLVRELRLRGQISGDVSSSDLEAVQHGEAELITAIHGKRQHASTDNVTELRISYTPHRLIPIDLDNEEPDDELPVDGDSGDEAPLMMDNDNDGPISPSKKRAPPTYDPLEPEKLWIFETFLKVGVPLKVQDWEESFRNPRKFIDMKHVNKEATKPTKAKKKTAKNTKSSMPIGALDQFTKVTKPGQATTVRKANYSEKTSIPSAARLFPPISSAPNTHLPPYLPSSMPAKATPEVIDLLSSSPVRPEIRSTAIPNLSSTLDYELPSTITKRRRSPLRRTQTDTAIFDLRESTSLRATTPDGLHYPAVPESPSLFCSPSQLLPTKKARRGDKPINAPPTKPKTPSKGRKKQSAELSSPARQPDITQYFSPSSQRKSQGRRFRAPPRFRIPSSPVIESMDMTESPVPERSEFDMKASTKPTTTSSGRQDLAEMDVNLAGSQGGSQGGQQQPKPKSSSKTSSSRRRTPPPSQEVESLDLTEDTIAPFRLASKSRNSKVPQKPKQTTEPISSSNSQRQHITKTKTTQLKRKEVVRLRDSLNGAFAIEYIDLSHEEAGLHFSHKTTASVGAAAGGRKVFRMSEVGFLDLTGDG